MNRKQLAELFGRDVKTIGKHINNALKEELDDSAVANFATTAADGKTYQVKYYNLDMLKSQGEGAEPECSGHVLADHARQAWRFR